MLNGPVSFSRFIQPRFEHLPRIGLKAYDTIHGIDIQITSNKVLKRTGKLLFELQGTLRLYVLHRDAPIQKNRNGW